MQQPESREHSPPQQMSDPLQLLPFANVVHALVLDTGWQLWHRLELFTAPGE